MAKKTRLGSTNRYGARYGVKNKEKVASLEKQHRRRQKCPFCNYVKVKRLSAGIWQCEKCNAKFAGKSYSFVNPKSSKEMVREDVEEPEDLEDQEEMLEEEQPEEGDEGSSEEEPGEGPGDSEDEKPESGSEGLESPADDSKEVPEGGEEPEKPEVA